MISRPQLLDEVLRHLTQFRAVALLGARQVGKTTLVRLLGQQVPIARYFDLENPADQAALSVPYMALSALTGLVVIDEIQRMPKLFEILRPLCDRDPLPARFILLGSASSDLVKGVSESLAGRCAFINVPGLSLAEVGPAAQQQLWGRGGFPLSFTAPSDQQSMTWRRNFASTFLERDLPQLGIRIPAATLRRFWTMTAHYHGQIWNASELARSLDTTNKTVVHYRDILAGAFMLRVLQPWFENVGKRLVKSPKVYLRDSGMLHALLELDSMQALSSSPQYGASWEGFALEQTLIELGEHNAYFYATQSGAELDLLLIRKGQRWGFEYKCTDAPRMTASLATALTDLGLEKAWVVYPGTQRYPIHEKVEALPLRDVRGDTLQFGQ